MRQTRHRSDPGSGPQQRRRSYQRSEKPRLACDRSRHFCIVLPCSLECRKRLGAAHGRSGAARMPCTSRLAAPAVAGGMSMKLKNDLMVRVARGEEAERTPIWLFRFLQPFPTRQRSALALSLTRTGVLQASGAPPSRVRAVQEGYGLQLPAAARRPEARCGVHDAADPPLRPRRRDPLL